MRFNKWSGHSVGAPHPAGNTLVEIECKGIENRTVEAKTIAWNNIDLVRYRSAIAGTEGWVEWSGGDCPVDSKAMVETLLRCNVGSDITIKDIAKTWDWSWDPIDDLNIVAYKLIAAQAPAADMVNKPPHYQILPGVEVYDVRVAMLNKMPGSTPYAQVSDWDRATEYLLRMWQKNGLEDAKKARWYLDKLIEKMG